MNKRVIKQLSLAVALAGAAALAFSVQAQPGGAGPGPMGQPPMAGPGAGPQGDPFAGLNLSDEQRSKAQQVMNEQRQAHMGNMQKMQPLGQQLNDLYKQETWDAAQIGAVYDQIFDLQKKSILSTVETHNKIMGLLNEQQRQQLKQRQSEMGPGAGAPPPGRMGPAGPAPR